MALSAKYRARLPGATHIYNNVVSWKLPRIEVQPIVRNLNLVTIDDLLLEDPISISQPVAPSGVIQRCQRVEETRREPSQTTISKRSVMLLLDNILNPEPELRQAL